ncbi:hypothetical protein PanWU01x14_261800, partial [Parasponia andersonii]
MEYHLFTNIIETEPEPEPESEPKPEPETETETEPKVPCRMCGRSYPKGEPLQKHQVNAKRHIINHYTIFSCGIHLLL